MSYLDWHVGMKVVCIKRGPWALITGLDTGRPKPKYGEICTISRFVMASEKCIGLAEYVGSDVFRSRFFRPLVTRKTDISCFTAMLHSTKDKVQA